MNMHDSDRMREVLGGAGFTEETASEDADILVINTCSVREKAEHKLRSLVGRLAKERAEGVERLIVVAGCVAQQEKENIRKAMPAVDIVVGPDNIRDLPALIEASSSGAPQLRTQFDLDAPHFLSATDVHGSGATAFVTIMKGCNERCSFCIVPTTRGPERYRASHEVVTEIAHLVERGVREITLLGQTVNSYRDPSASLPLAPDSDEQDPDESEFAALLWRITDAVPGLLRLRYTSPHPRHVVPSLIRAHRELAPLMPHVHMPVQSGSNAMLKRMIRRYTREEYLERMARLRAARPGLTLASDVIVGFPGETEEDFAQTLSLVAEVGFKGVYGFKYSERPGTPSLRLKNDVSEADKSRRLAALFDVSESLLHKHLRTLVGTTQRVLVEGPRGHANSDGEPKLGDARGTAIPVQWGGRTEGNEIVHLPAGGNIVVGQVVEVKIVQAFKHSLLAEGATNLNAAAAAGPRRLSILSPEVTS